jgi:hypothetical protein
MMLHIWPTQRDQLTHTQEEEKFKIGTPKLVHYVPFGNCLILRADVCHGGCFGATGNMRLHLVLRRKDCTLPVVDRLHILENSGADKADYKEKKGGLDTCF